MGINLRGERYRSIWKALVAATKSPGYQKKASGSGGGGPGVWFCVASRGREGRSVPECFAPFSPVIPWLFSITRALALVKSAHFCPLQNFIERLNRDVEVDFAVVTAEKRQKYTSHVIMSLK